MDEEDFFDLTFGDHPEYITIEPEKVFDTTRWHNIMEMVVQEKATEKYYRVTWGVGATEYQECEPDPYFTEVFPKEVTTTVYTTK